MKNNVIFLGNTVKEVAERKYDRRVKRHMMRRILSDNGYKPLLDEHGEETGEWNNIMVNPLLILSERVAYNHALQMESFLKDNFWQAKIDITRFHGWQSVFWQTTCAVPTWKALQITKQGIGRLGIKKQ